MPAPKSVDLRLSVAGSRLRLRMGSIPYMNWTTARHCNASYELHILLEGSCRLEVVSRRYALKAGDAAIIAPGRFHCPEESSTPFARFSLSFSPEGGMLENFLKKAVGDCVAFSVNSTLCALCREIYDEMQKDDLFQADLVPSLLLQLLVYVFRAIDLPLQASSDHRLQDADRRTDIIDHFFGYWLEEFGREADLAAQLHLSRRQLNRVLVQYYGMGFRQKLLQTRMEHAAWLLRTTDQKIGEIAFRTGYHTESSFFKVFKTYFNATPQEYRNSVESMRRNTQCE